MATSGHTWSESGISKMMVSLFYLERKLRDKSSQVTEEISGGVEVELLPSRSGSDR